MANRLTVPRETVEKIRSVFEELLEKPAKKIEDEFEKLLNKKKQPEKKTETWPDRIVPIKEKADIAREDSTRVLKLSDAMEAVYRVLNNEPDWGPRAGEPGRPLNKDEAWKFLDDFMSNMLTGDTTVESKMTRIAELMTLKLLSQKKPRQKMTKRGNFRV